METGRTAATADPAGYPELAGDLSNLCGALQIRFDRNGDTAHIDDAVQAGQKAVTVMPPGYISRPEILSNLGAALRTRFQRTGTG